MISSERAGLEPQGPRLFGGGEVGAGASDTGLFRVLPVRTVPATGRVGGGPAATP